MSGWAVIVPGPDLKQLSLKEQHMGSETDTGKTDMTQPILLAPCSVREVSPLDLGFFISKNEEQVSHPQFHLLSETILPALQGLFLNSEYV